MSPRGTIRPPSGTPSVARHARRRRRRRSRLSRLDSGLPSRPPGRAYAAQQGVRPFRLERGASASSARRSRSTGRTHRDCQFHQSRRPFRTANAAVAVCYSRRPHRDHTPPPREISVESMLSAAENYTSLSGDSLLICSHSSFSMRATSLSTSGCSSAYRRAARISNSESCAYIPP